VKLPPLALAVTSLALTSCARPAPPAPAVDDDPRFACRIAVSPLHTALRTAGGDRAEILYPNAAADLARLTVNARYKFVLDGERRFAIAPVSDDAPRNPYDHPVLGGGSPVRSAGGLRVLHARGRVERVVLDAQSHAYCTTAESLRPAVRALVALGVVASRITVEGRPFACVEASAPPRYGPIMVRVGQRYELLGRALVAGRWELAAYALHELDEELDELPGATPPEEVARAVLGPALASLRQRVPALEQAVTARDAAAARAAYAAASTTCNACHAAAQHGYIIVPSTSGEVVPSTSPDDAGVVAAVAPTRPSRAGARCNDRTGCGGGLVCCTHGGAHIAWTSHDGTCMDYRACNTQPSAARR
jgi:hypothetical protein